MKFLGIAVCSLILATTPPGLHAQDQDPNAGPKCDIPVMKSTEVDRKMKMLSKPNPKYTDDEVVKHAGSVMILRAVFCGSGEITNIRVVRGISDSINAKTIEAVKKIKFQPAEKDGNKVSTFVTLEYRLTVSRIF